MMIGLDRNYRVTVSKGVVYATFRSAQIAMILQREECDKFDFCILRVSEKTRKTMLIFHQKWQQYYVPKRDHVNNHDSGYGGPDMRSDNGYGGNSTFRICSHRLENNWCDHYRY